MISYLALYVLFNRIGNFNALECRSLTHCKLKYILISFLIRDNDISILSNINRDLNFFMNFRMFIKFENKGTFFYLIFHTVHPSEFQQHVNKSKLIGKSHEKSHRAKKGWDEWSAYHSEIELRSRIGKVIFFFKFDFCVKIAGPKFLKI